MPFAIPHLRELLPALRDVLQESPLNPVRLPRDELAHDYPVEWWYFAGHLQAVEGDDGMSFMLTAIRGTTGVLPPATVSFWKRIDHRRGPLHLLQSGAAFALAYDDRDSPASYRFRYSGNAFNLWIASPETWEIDGQPGRYRLQLWNDTGEVEVDLTLTATGPAVLLGRDGIVDYGEDHHLAYYVRPKIRAAGSARIDGQLCRVTGSGWYERQWGGAPPEAYAWKYVNVALDDDEQWIFFHTKLGQAVRYYAGRMPAAGGLEVLSLDATRFRNVDVQGRPFGTDLQVDTPAGPVELRVRPLFDGEPDIRSIYPGVPAFWESACRVDGTRNGVPIRGWSMTELHGYE
jgi:predicted secreted hydrolase